jgi:hypothetical protein
MTGQHAGLPRDERGRFDVEPRDWDLVTQIPLPVPDWRKDAITSSCRCDGCKYGHNPGSDAVLYSGYDVMYLLERAAIRDGRYEDAEAFGARVHRGRMAEFDALREGFDRRFARAWHLIEALRGAA